jgi:Fic family protein
MNKTEKILNEYLSLNLHGVIDYDKFNQYSIVHHSTVIEGSTLTENETRVLLEDGVTPKGKPLEHSLMVKDHFDALQFTIESAKKKAVITVNLVQAMNALILKHTGNMYQTVFGEIDASRGEFRKGNVSAGGSYFVNYDKVAPYTKALVEKLQSVLADLKATDEKLKLSFSAHFDLVSIHPFYDGNGRTSRLLMNFIQEYYQLPLAIVFKEDKADYFTALQQTRLQENMEIFYDFMFAQYHKFLIKEIEQYRKDIPLRGKGFSLFF